MRARGKRRSGAEPARCRALLAAAAAPSDEGNAGTNARTGAGPRPPHGPPAPPSSFPLGGDRGTAPAPPSAGQRVNLPWADKKRYVLAHAVC